MTRVPHHSEIDYKKLALFLLILVLIIGIVIGGWMFVREYLELKKYKDSRDTSRLQEKLGAHLVLPEEEPLIATVTDVERLKKEQAFYRNAQNGDVIFIWNDKALIFRESEDKIVDFGIIVPRNPVESQEAEAVEETVDSTETPVPTSTEEQDTDDQTATTSADTDR